MCNPAQGYYQGGDDEEEEGYGAWVINPNDQVADHEGTELEEE